MLMHPDFGTRNAAATKIEWPETEDIPPITVASASFTNVATTVRRCGHRRVLQAERH
jgi:hypothetical protein